MFIHLHRSPSGAPFGAWQRKQRDSRGEGVDADDTIVKKARMLFRARLYDPAASSRGGRLPSAALFFKDAPETQRSLFGKCGEDRIDSVQFKGGAATCGPASTQSAEKTDNGEMLKC